MSRKSRNQASRAKQRVAEQAARQRQVFLDKGLVRTGQRVFAEGVTQGRLSMQDFYRARNALLQANVSPPFRALLPDGETMTIPREEPVKKVSSMETKPRPVVPNLHEKQFPVAEWRYIGMGLGTNHMLRKDLYCCGVKEIHGVQVQFYYEHRTDGSRRSVTATPVDFFRDVQHEMQKIENHRPFWVYTVAGACKIGDQIKAVIEKNNLGTVMVTEPAYNYNSGNHVRVYIWTAPEKFRSMKLDEIDYDT